MKDSLIIKGPYHFKRALNRLSIDPLVVLDVEKETISVPLWIEDTPIVALVHQVGTINEPVFTISAATDNRLYFEEVKRQLESIFHWNVPLQEIAAHFKGTDEEALFEGFKGTPFVGDFQKFGCLLKVIIHQQLNMTFAYTLSSRFITTYGHEQDGVWFHPRPKTVSELQPEELKKLQFSKRKAEYIIDLAKMIVNKELILDELEELSNEACIKKLVAIRGIGPWTAENYLMFGLGRLDLLPLLDVGVQNGMKKYYQLSDKPSKEWMLAKSAEWSPYRTYATLYFWELIGNGA